MEKTLKLYRLSEDGFSISQEDSIDIFSESGIRILAEESYIPFPSREEQVITSDFEVHKELMGSVPYITMTISHRLCLDDLWTKDVFTIFNGERYFIKSTPSSSKDNEDQRYKHEIELLSERDILNHVYYVDAVQGDSSVDRFRTNTTEVQFSGDIKEFVDRLNDVLSYRGLKYSAVLDEDVESEVKDISFSDKYITEAIQEGYSTYDIPYYFDGYVIHFGYLTEEVDMVMKYGFDNELLSISKENANYEYVTNVYGRGSSDNIPYYYPNDTEKGQISAKAGENNFNLTDEYITITDANLFATKVNEGDVITLKKFGIKNVSSSVCYKDTKWDSVETCVEGKNVSINVQGNASITLKTDFVSELDSVNFVYEISIPNIDTTTPTPHNFYVLAKDSTVKLHESNGYISSVYSANVGKGSFTVYCEFSITNKRPREITTVNIEQKLEEWSPKFNWILNGNVVNLSDLGLSVPSSASSDIHPYEGDTITQVVDSYIKPVRNLMPPIYRESLGAESFYPAKNDTYETDEKGVYYHFNNEYDESEPHEVAVDFEDIKPTIKGIENNDGERIDMFLDFDYDQYDNDTEVDDNGDLVHSYFYAKLRKTNGKYGFNIFDSALAADGTMTINMTSGICASCAFEIGVDEETQSKNIVQVDSQGNLLRDSNGNVLLGEPQDRQQDTYNNEVWIALKKDNSTYNTVMPNVQNKYKPSTSDTFVITNIQLPKAYILNAEDRLKDAIIKYMSENNDEKFNFSISFSRIFMAENKEIAEQIKEGSKINVEYNGKTYSFYITSYTYKMSSDDALPEISVDITNTISSSTDSLTNKITSVVGDAIETSNQEVNIDNDKRYIRKDAPDYTNFKLSMLGGLDVRDGLSVHDGMSVNGDTTFNDKVKFGNDGYKVEDNGNAKLNEISLTDNVKSDNFSQGVLGNGFLLEKKNDAGRSYLELDEIYVRVKAYFDSLEIKHLYHVGGVNIISPASISCIGVDYILSNDEVTAYRCYFKNDDGERKIYNEFRIGDLAQCRSFNIEEGVYENVSNQYYWRKVVGLGENYIDLSNISGEYDEGSGEPSSGDAIVCLGNTDDVTRQNAIILASYGDGSPYIIQYSGIDSFSLEGKDKVIISPSKNKFTGEFLFESGESIETSINQAISDSNTAKENAENALLEAQEAKDRLDEWSKDGVISPTEKQSIKDEIKRIDSDHEYINSSYEKYSLGEPTDYNNAYTIYREQLVSLSSDEPEIITIPSSFDDNQTSYYNYRTSALNAISEASKEYVNTTVSNESGIIKQYIDGKISATNESFKTEYTKINEYIDGQVKTLQTSINQNAESISTQASRTDGLVEQVSQIQQTADNISLKVETIWPKNIFPDGDFRYGTLANITADNIGYVKNASANINGNTVKSLYLETKDGNSFAYLGQGQIPVIAGKVYSIVLTCYSSGSFYESGGGTGAYFTKDSSLTSAGFTPFYINFIGAWSVNFYKVTAPAEANYLVLRLGTINQSDKKLYFTNIMVFEGDLTNNVPPLETFISGENDGLLATGIDIENKKITVTTDQFVVQNNKGDITAKINENGYLETSGGIFNNVNVNGSFSVKPNIITSSNKNQYITLDTGQGFTIVRFNFNGNTEIVIQSWGGFKDSIDGIEKPYYINFDYASFDSYGDIFEDGTEVGIYNDTTDFINIGGACWPKTTTSKYSPIEIINSLQLAPFQYVKIKYAGKNSELTRQPWIVVGGTLDLVNNEFIGEAYLYWLEQNYPNYYSINPSTLIL